jgi:hypothetical protein
MVVGAILCVVGEPAAAKTYKPGQSATTSGIKVKVYGVQEPYTSTNQFVTASAGKHFVVVDLELTNKSSEQKVFSSALGLHLLDSTHHQYEESFQCVATIDPKVPDGQLPSKVPLRGFTCFEIPDGSVGLVLRVQGSLTADGALFKLTTKTGTPIPAKS